MKRSPRHLRHSKLGPALGLWALVLAAGPAFTEGDAAAPLSEIRVRVGNAADQNEEAQMKQLVSHLLGQPATEELGKEAEQILNKTGRYRSAVCRFGKNANAGRMTCGLTRSRTIRFIRTEGLPPSFLETDFRKRIFLKEGELIDMGVDHGVVEKSGAWYSYDGDRIGQGCDNVRQFLRENPDIAQAIEQTVRTNVGLAPIDEMTLKPAVPIDTVDAPEVETAEA